MARSRFSKILAVATMFALTSLAGCGSSPPSRYYALSSLEIPVHADAISTDSVNTTLAIGPVTIPDYLDRPEIVTRSSRNQLTLAEFDRWGGSLATDINRVLVENISLQLVSQGVSVVMWRTPAPARYKIPVSFTRFEVSGETAVLWAQWGIVDQEKNTSVVTRESVMTKPVAGKMYIEVVAAMSDALADLSKDIAKAMKAVIEGGKTSERRLP